MATIENALWNQILKALLYPIKQLDLYFIGNSKHTEVLKQVRTWYIFFQEITVNSMEDKLKAPKNGCFQTVVLEKALESPLDCKEIKPVNPKGNQSWIFIGRTDAEAETPILWSPDAKSQLTGRSPDAKKDWRPKEKGGGRGWDGLYGTTDSRDMSLSKLQEVLKDREAWRAAVHGVVESQTQLSDWTHMETS